MARMPRLFMREDSVEEDGPVIEGEDKQIDAATLCCPHPVSGFLSAIIFPSWLCSARVIDQKEQAAVLYYGRYVGSITEPGIHVLNPCGAELRKVSAQRQAITISSHKCVDSCGNPVLVSVNVVFRIRSVKRATVDVNVGKHATFLHQVAPMVVRRVCAGFPYESSSGPCLRGRPGFEYAVSDALRQQLQEAVLGAGLEVIQCDITDLSYAPEIAAAMLQRQQAQATVEARHLVVQSAVDISSQAIQRMKQLGHHVSPQGEERILGSLLTVICGHSGVQPTLPV